MSNPFTVDGLVFEPEDDGEVAYIAQLDPFQVAVYAEGKQWCWSVETRQGSRVFFCIHTTRTPKVAAEDALAVVRQELGALLRKIQPSEPA